jgi:hypothetical protein
MKLGFQCVMSRNTGTYAVPVWNPLELVRDATLNVDANETDVTTRAANGWDQTEPTTKKAEVTFTLMHDNTNTDFTTIRDAFLNRTALDMAVLDGGPTTAGSEGLRANWKVFVFRRAENLRESVAYEVTIKPCYDSVNPPTWMTVA